jgi:hypothetical protein
MSRGQDPATWLERALSRMADAAGLTIGIDGLEIESWASATFVGARLTLVVTGADSVELERWVAALPDAEFVPGRYVVIDLAIDSSDVADGWRRSRLGILLVENR